MKIASSQLRSAILTALMLMAVASNTLGMELQGQNKGDTNTWSSVNLQNWLELDYIPFRVYFPSGSAGTYNVELDFPHLSGTTPGFEDLTSFTAFTPNVQFTSAPLLHTDPSGTWYYTFTVQVTNNNAGEVRFFARLAAGAHLNPGSSLHLSGNAGLVQIHKPGPAPGAPNLAIIKTGPSTATAGSTITYTLTYTNTSATDVGNGSQISDILPTNLTVVAGSLSTNAHVVGNTIFWDLTNVLARTGGRVTFQATISPAVIGGTVITNFSQILSSENDANMSDNTSTWLTTITSGCIPPTGTISGNTNLCPASTLTLIVNASGTTPFTYQWRHNGTNVGGATGSTYVVASTAAADTGAYDVLLGNMCGSSTSAPVAVSLKTPVSATPLTNVTTCAGSSVAFTTTASGTGPFSYMWYKDGSLQPNQTATLTIASVSQANAGVYRVEVSGACGTVTNSATLTVNQPLVISAPLTNQTTCPGNNIIFAVGATGTSLSYQWYKGGTLLGGQTSSSLALNSVSNVNAGTYSVVVSGGCGTVVTNNAVLTVNQNVVIATPLTNQTVCPGNNVLFAVGATGTSLSFQWYKDSAILSGQTTSSLTLNSVSNANAGTYSVVVGGVCGNPITNSATLTVNQNTLITGSLTNQTACPGDNVLFAIGATGTSLSYQWYKGGALLSGRTASTLALNSVSNVNAGTYSVVVSGACGNPVTNSATLTVNQNTIVTGALTNQTVCPGNNVLLAIGATGTSLSYQWYKDGSILLGSTGSVVTLNNVTSTNTGAYSVIVSGACGSPITNSAILTVNQNVAITHGLNKQGACPGDNVTFTIDATGTSLSYQWYKDGALLSGRTASSLTLNSVSNVNAGAYSVVVSGACGNPLTNSALLTVSQNVVLATPLTNQTVCPGNNVIFAVGATGSGLNYQWYKDSSILSGQTSASLSLNSVSNVNAGVYSVAISGACGTPVTNSATLTVNENVLITAPLTNQTVCPGNNVLLAIDATGSSLAYQWYKGGALLSGRTASTLALNSVSNANAGTYSVVVSGACGGALTNSAILTVNTNAIITGALTNQTVCPGDNVIFAIGATGTSLTYQWYKDSSILSGQTAATLSLNTVSNVNAGTYSVVVSGACGNPVTNSATLTVNLSTTASALPNLSVKTGETVTLGTTATGSGTLKYVWKLNGTVIPGATNNSLSITNIGESNIGTYTVEVTGACGTAIASGSLTLNSPPTVTIYTPTNGSVFIAPATFTIAANAYDSDGTVTNVEFYNFGTNFLGQTTNSLPAVIFQTNLPVGNYTYTAVATDNLGARGTSAPVSISVIAEPPLTVISAIHLDLQTGLFVEKVRVFNPTPDGASAARVYISNLAPSTTVHNASGITNGTNYVQSQSVVPAGGYVDLTIEYADPFRITPNPTLHAALVQPEQGGGAAVSGTIQPINRVIMLADGTFLIEFLSQSNQVYYIEYSSDLINWKTAQPAITGTGTYIQWIDSGQPKTDSLPSSVPARYYRLIMLP